jgi:uncharacterized repeat protein (TIGR03806 family)
MRGCQLQRAGLVACLGLIVWTSVEAADRDWSKAPAGIRTRVPMTTSKVIGAPDPPPPLMGEKIFTKLSIKNPLYIIELQGTTDLLVLPQDGKIVRFENRPDVDKADVFLDLTKRETYGMTFHPKFAENGYIYILNNLEITEPAKDGMPEKKIKKDRLSRFTVSRTAPYACDANSEFNILEWASNGHNGGEPAFGPDGFLYIPAGDGTSDSDTDDTGQDLKDLNAVMIRIDVDNPEPGKTYAVPKDNPFLDVKGARPEIWAFGFRNPWRATFDRKTGQLWVGNIGQDQWEMIHIVKKGENYGWARYEGGHPFHEQRPPSPTPVTKPTIEHPHSEARSITGGIVYSGKKYPEYAGCYLYGDYSTGKVWAAKHDGTNLTFHKEIADTTAAILGFCEDSQGEILMADYAGAFWKLVPSPKIENPPKFPTKLSETGLFVSVPEHKLHDSLVPYSVNAALWSDGAHKERFYGIPEAPAFAYAPTNGWNIPDNSVLVKSFSLDLEAGNPKSRRRIETRLMTKQQNEWVGYSYLWNDEQTDAELVTAAGIDKTYEIKDPAAEGGMRKQTWHYPSRAECMVCHSRAANYVLGLSEPQFNRDHDYGGGFVANQLEVLEHLGLTKLPKPAAELTKLVDPYDDSQPLDKRARSYLHSNCAVCHVAAGGGNARMELSFHTPWEKTLVYDEKPQHQTFAIPDARVIAPGSPERSVMFQRLSRRGQGQMPPLATSIRDEKALILLREWIQKVEKPKVEEKKPEEKK